MGQPVILRVSSPQAASVLNPTRCKREHQVGDIFNAQPMQLKVLPRRHIGEATAVALGQVPNRANLVGIQDTTAKADPHHEALDRTAELTFAVTLGIDAPPAKAHVQIIRWNGVKPLRDQRMRSGIISQGIALRFQSLMALRLGFFARAHRPGCRHLDRTIHDL